MASYGRISPHAHLVEVCQGQAEFPGFGTERHQGVGEIGAVASNGSVLLNNVLSGRLVVPKSVVNLVGVDIQWNSFDEAAV